MCIIDDVQNVTHIINSIRIPVAHYVFSHFASQPVIYVSDKAST
jgi:hypothetical protein